MSEIAQPRYFWRRFAAFALDLLCSSVVGALLVLLLSFATDEKVHLSKGVLSGKETCKDYDPIPQVFQDWAGPLEVTQATVCTYRPYFVFPYQRRLTLYRGKAGQSSGVESVGGLIVNTYAVTENLKIEPLLELDVLLAQFVLLLGSAFCIGRFRTTPGKWLLELRVEGQGCILCRELRRTGVFLLLSSVSVAVFSATHVWSSGSSLVYVQFADARDVNWGWAIAIYGGLGTLFALYYVLPWLRWRGAMPYDKATGFRVTRG